MKKFALVLIPVFLLFLFPLDLHLPQKPDQREPGSVSGYTPAAGQTSYAASRDIVKTSASSSGNDLSDHMVTITRRPDRPAPTVISSPDWSVEPIDSKAIGSTRSTLVYLEGLSRQRKVVFGHQNDTFRYVNSNGISDVEDMTGDISGLMGTDSLYLAGNGYGNPDLFSQMLLLSEQTAARGAILSLSAHMPNFSSEKIQLIEDGRYDFSACTINEARDLSNDCAAESLPGGKYNKRFCGYLDIIADYFLALQEKGITVLFRPFHEGNGGWFWWGTCTDARTYRKLYQYTVSYMKEKGVHNLLYVYSVSGPVTDEESFLERYPGDDYVDIFAFDLYDDYRKNPDEYNPQFFERLESSCRVLDDLAQEHGKISAISETGIWVLKEDGSDSQGLRLSGNPILHKNWYSKIGEIAIDNHISYFMVWNSLNSSSTHLPYKTSATTGHELVNEFIQFYNEDYTLFASEIVLPGR